MSAFSSFLHMLSSPFHSAPKTITKTGNGTFVTPSGGASSRPNNGSGLASTANYYNPNAIAQFQPLQPLSTLDASGYETGSYPGYSGGGYVLGDTYQGGSAGTTDGQPTIDLNPYRNAVRNRVNQLNDIYNSLFGAVDNTVKDRVASANSDYDQQLSGLQSQYGQTAKTSANMFGARGLGSSSYSSDAQDQAANTLNDSISNIGKQRQNTLAQLGNYAATQKAQFGAGKNQFNGILDHLGDYDLATLTNYRDQLDSAISSAQAQQAGLGTNADFINGLNAITPVKDQGTATLASMLQKLVTSSAPIFAKKQIAQGLITQSQLTDKNAQDYWQNYFQNLLTQNGQANPVA